MTVIRFPYTRVCGGQQPIIPIGIKFGEFWKPLEVYVDSGATYTLIRSQEIDETSFDYRTGKRVAIQVGSGSLITVYLHQLQVQLGSELLSCPIGISEQLGIRLNVLGKIGIFEHFKVCFHQPQGAISFEKIELQQQER